MMLIISIINAFQLKKAVKNENSEKFTKIIIKYGIPEIFFRKNNKHDIYQLLCFAINENLPEVTKQILTNKNFSTKNNYDFSKVLRLTIKNENLKMIRMVLNKVITEHLEVTEYPMLLVIAIKKNNLQMAELFIKYGTVINPGVLEDDFLLIYAVENRQLSMIRLLLDNGAAMKNDNSKMICNLLHLALCYNCNSEVIELLLTYRNDQINMKNKNGDCALLRAVVLNKNTKTINILLENGADINAPNYDGQTSLDFLVKRLAVSSISSYTQIFKTVKIIIEHIAKMKALNFYVSEHNLSLISLRDDMSNYLKQCEEEILLMKSCKVWKTRVLFFDILGKSIVNLTKFAGNKKVVRYFNGEDLKVRFPTYATAMKKRLREALELESDIEKCVTIFQNYLNSPVLPGYCFDNIFRYCTKYDLRNLSKICDSNF